MRKITKLMFALAMFVGGVTSANAQDEPETIEMTADMFYNWDGYGANAKSLSSVTVDFKLNEEIGAGSQVCGTSTVDYLIYADFTDCVKMIFEGTAGVQLRVLMNRQISNNGPLDEANVTIGSNGSVELDLKKYPYVHLNAIKTGWGSQAGQITAIKLVKATKEELKEKLANIINTAQGQDRTYRTEESMTALSNAIDAAEKAQQEEADTETFVAVIKELYAAIEGVKMMEGYTNLTVDIYKEWKGFGADAEPEKAGYLENNIGKELVSGNTIFGDGGVNGKNYADLTQNSKIIFKGTENTPVRMLFNRQSLDGSGAFIERIVTIGEDGTVEFDMSEFPYVHLNVIKIPNGGSGMVSGVYFYQSKTVSVKIDTEIGYRTFASRFATDWSNVDGVTAFIAEVDGAKVTFEEVEGTVPANTGLLLRADDEKGEYLVPIVESASSIESELICNYTTPVATTVPAGSFVLYKKGEDVGFYKTTAEFTVGANTAYIPAVAGARTFIALPGGETTGVKAIEAAEADGKCYDLQGRQVSNPTKGLYISNGKKYVVK